MSYAKKNGRIILEVSPQDYQNLADRLTASGAFTYSPGELHALINRIREGDPEFEPYSAEQIEQENKDMIKAGNLR